MSFLNPYLLWGLLAVSIPVIIHLFNFRRFRRIYFTNVKFLEELQQQTRRQSQLRHILVMILRMLAITSLVLAFAQPYIPLDKTGAKPENVIVDVGVPYLNREAFADLPSTPGGMPLHFGNAPRYQPDLRGWHGFGENLSLIKRTPIKVTEGAYFELRLDAINIFNRIGIANPDTNTSDPESFGMIYGKSGGPRTMQLGLRISF